MGPPFTYQSARRRTEFTSIEGTGRLPRPRLSSVDRDRGEKDGEDGFSSAGECAPLGGARDGDSAACLGGDLRGEGGVVGVVEAEEAGEVLPAAGNGRECLPVSHRRRLGTEEVDDGGAVQANAVVSRHRAPRRSLDAEEDS